MTLRLGRRDAGRVLITTLLAIGTACSDRPTPPEVVARDTLAPRLTILFPTATSFDEDGDGLVDLRVEWADTSGRIDLATVRVRLIGPTSSDTSLLDTWSREKLDSTGLVLHETVAALRPAGMTRIEVSVRDTAGNESRDTVAAVLPYVALVKTITTGLPGGVLSAEDVEICPDDNLLYMTVGERLLIVRPDSLAFVALTPPYVQRPSGGRLDELLCVSGDPRIYITESVLHRWNRASGAWEGYITSAFASSGLASSRADPDLFYAGERGGAIGVIRRSTQTRERQILQYSDRQYTFIVSIAVMPGDSKLYIPYFADWGRGIWVVDPARDSVLTRIYLIPGVDGSGTANEFALTRDASRLYATVIDGVPMGVYEIDTQADTIRRRLDLGHPGIGLALSPDERRLFVTTQDRDLNSQSQNALVDVASFTVLQYLPRPRPAGGVRYDRGVIFRPDGRYIFVTHDANLDIYLHRN